jgi:hypothetical protein
LSRKETDRFLDHIRTARIRMYYRQSEEAMAESKRFADIAKKAKAKAKRLEKRFDEIMGERKGKTDETREGHKEAQASVHQDA